ncbi:hypothetical protein ACTFIV_006922 [Dictyostelium citrinum]
MFESLFICPSLFLGSNEEKLIAKIKAPIYELPEELFRKVSYRDRPDGLLGVAFQMKRTLQDLKQVNKPSLYVIAEAIEKPGNLGTILRSSDAAGVDAVIVCDRCTDIYNPNVVRASVGTLFTLPVIEARSQEVLTWLRANKIQTVATTPDASLSYYEASLTASVAIVVGTEQLGLSRFWLDSADISLDNAAILLCDNHLLVIDKPAEVATQPDLTEMGKLWVKKKFNKPGNVFLEPIHRLDKPVAGVVIFARTSKALSRLQEQMRDRKIKKIYHAWVQNTPPLPKGILRHFLVHEEFHAKISPHGKEAVLAYEVVENRVGKTYGIRNIKAA